MHSLWGFLTLDLSARAENLGRRCGGFGLASLNLGSLVTDEVVPVLAILCAGILQIMVTH